MGLPAPGLRMPTGRGQGHMVLRKQCPGDRLPGGDYDHVVPRQHGARCLLSIWHGGGYTYRLCKMPADGKTALTEECFTKNVLKFADNMTFWRHAWIEHRDDGWTAEYKTDVTVGTYPEGSAWRDHGTWRGFPAIFKDHVMVPEDLEPGEYVLGWRWDAMSGSQVWVSCSNIEII